MLIKDEDWVYINIIHYVFQGILFQYRFLEQLNVTKILSGHLRPIYLLAISQKGGDSAINHASIICQEEV